MTNPALCNDKLVLLAQACPRDDNHHTSYTISRAGVYSADCIIGATVQEVDFMHVCIIGASLSEPHTSTTAFAEVVCMFVAIYRKF